MMYASPFEHSSQQPVPLSSLSPTPSNPSAEDPRRVMYILQNSQQGQSLLAPDLHVPLVPLMVPTFSYPILGSVPGSASHMYSPTSWPQFNAQQFLFPIPSVPQRPREFGQDNRTYVDVPNLDSTRRLHPFATATSSRLAHAEACAIMPSATHFGSTHTEMPSATHFASTHAEMPSATPGATNSILTHPGTYAAAPDATHDAKRQGGAAKNSEAHINRIQRRRKRDSATSRYRGVSWHRRDRRWVARAWIKGKITSVGSFKTELEAAKAVEARYIEEYGLKEGATDLSKLFPTESNLSFHSVSTQPETLDAALSILETVQPLVHSPTPLDTVRTVRQDKL